jgi:ABC-type glycerol-3-phosphate transport system substrate-binding protein
MWVQGDPSWDYGFMTVQQTIIDQFNEIHPNITIERVGTTDVRLDEKVLLSAKAGNPPDLTQFSSQFLESHVAANTLMPIDDYMAQADQEWVNDLLDIERVNMTSRRTGNRYGLLISVHSRLLYYRTDLMPAAPESWDDIAKYALENTDEATGKWGYIFNGASPWSVEVAFAPFIWSQGGAITDDKGRATWASPETEKAVAWHRDAIYKDQFASIANVTGNYGDMWKMFLNGSAAMGIEGTFGLLGIQGEGQELWEAGKIWATPIPGPTADSPNPTFANGWSTGIPVGSPHPDEAFELIAFWSSPDIQVIHSKEEGGAPIVRSAWPKLYTEEIILDVFFPNLDDNGRPMEPFVFYLEGLTALGKSIEEALTSEDSDIMAILTASQEEYNSKYYTDDGELREIPGA